MPILVRILCVSCSVALWLGCERRANVAWSPPVDVISVLTYNVFMNRGNPTAVMEEIQAANADIVCLQELMQPDYDRLKQELAYPHSCFFAEHWWTEADGTNHVRGIAILSKLQLSDAKVVPNGSGGTRGVWAVASGSSGRFMVASVHLSSTYKPTLAHINETTISRVRELSELVKAWQALGSPPLIIAGDFNSPPVGQMYQLAASHFGDSMSTLGKAEPTIGAEPLRMRIDYIFHSNQWRAIEGRVGTGTGSDHRSVLARLAAKKQNPTSTTN